MYYHSSISIKPFKCHCATGIPLRPIQCHLDQICVNYTSELPLCQFVGTLPLECHSDIVQCHSGSPDTRVILFSDKVGCGNKVCVNVGRINWGPKPVGTSDARGSSERLRRFMQRVALVRSVILGGCWVICNTTQQKEQTNKHQTNIPQ